MTEAYNSLWITRSGAEQGVVVSMYMSYGDKHCPICKVEKNPKKMKCDKCKDLNVRDTCWDEGYSYPIKK